MSQELTRLTNAHEHPKRGLHLVKGRAQELEHTKKLLTVAEQRRDELKRALVVTEGARTQLAVEQAMTISQVERLLARNRELELKLAAIKAKAETQKSVVDQLQKQVTAFLQEVAKKS